MDLPDPSPHAASSPGTLLVGAERSAAGGVVPAPAPGEAPATPAPPPGGADPGPGADDPAGLLSRRLRDLPLRIEGTFLEEKVRRLYEELEAAGLSLRPPAYLSDEWGCLEGEPAIGVPFYLVDPKLAALEQERGENLETPEEVSLYLRHEAGHAFNYAYLLYQREEWHEVFGPYSRPYLEDFQPNPFSRRYVRHLPGWYAQKHPDEDFAETFAVWLTPGSDWKERYRNWPAYRKLQFVDRVAGEVGRTPPAVEPRLPSAPEPEMEVSVEEHYRRRDERTAVAEAIREHFDGDLRAVFDADPAGDSADAADLLRRHRTRLTETLAFWTGARPMLVRALLDHLVDRSAALGLKASRPRESEQIARATVFATTLVMNYLYRGKFAEL